MRRVPGGYVYTVPQGAVVHCPMCPRGSTIPVGDECFMKSTEASHVYCMEHAPMLGRFERRPVVKREPDLEEYEARKVHHRREPYEQLVF